MCNRRTKASFKKGILAIKGWFNFKLQTLAIPGHNWRRLTMHQIYLTLCALICAVAPFIINCNILQKSKQMNSRQIHDFHKIRRPQHP
jgi:hypothetical protein